VVEKHWARVLRQTLLGIGTNSDAGYRWDAKLTLVATQDARNTALMGYNVNPGLELTIMHYCVLERIGRSRYMGEVTQGKVSLQLLGEDPKALFYHRKFLIKHKLIVKQVWNITAYIKIVKVKLFFCMPLGCMG
jgi:hypothetical protein